MTYLQQTLLFASFLPPVSLTPSFFSLHMKQFGAATGWILQDSKCPLRPGHLDFMAEHPEPQKEVDTKRCYPRGQLSNIAVGTGTFVFR